MLKKLLFCVGIFVVALQPVAAQQDYNNSFNFSYGNFFPNGESHQVKASFSDFINRFNPDELPNSFMRQTTYTYSRKIFKNVSVSVDYSKWQIKDHGAKYVVLQNITTPFYIGRPMQHRCFQMVDLGVNYKLTFLKNNAIILGVSGSYLTGLNSYLDSFYINPDPPYDGVLYMSEKKEHFFGLVPSFSYRCYFLKKRFNAGIDVKYRYYFNLDFKEIDYALSVGVSF